MLSVKDKNKVGRLEKEKIREERKCNFLLCLQGGFYEKVKGLKEMKEFIMSKCVGEGDGGVCYVQVGGGCRWRKNFLSRRNYSVEGINIVVWKV